MQFFQSTKSGLVSSSVKVWMCMSPEHIEYLAFSLRAQCVWTHNAWQEMLLLWRVWVCNECMWTQNAHSARFQVTYQKGICSTRPLLLPTSVYCYFARSWIKNNVSRPWEIHMQQDKSPWHSSRSAAQGLLARSWRRYGIVLVWSTPLQALPSSGSATCMPPLHCGSPQLAWSPPGYKKQWSSDDPAYTHHHVNMARYVGKSNLHL